ncbi:MAG: hypothetical protein J2O44_03315 [Porphyrobacter sp.]|nr:hypothetical protein [Porphyrobacter sp.]
MQSPRIVVFYLVLILSVVSALWKGGKPERIGALIILAMAVLQFGFLAVVPRYYRTVDLVSVLVDTVGLVGFGALAVYAQRVWPIWAASLQLLSLTSHFSRGVDANVKPLAYVFMKSGPTFLVVIALLLGTIFHRRRLRAHGADRAWTEW